MGFFTTLAGYAAPLFLVLSPIFSYGDQALSMSRKRSSAGFSLDIPLIMLVASLLRIFYYPGAHFDKALLVQSILMVAVQLVLLKIALDNRPPPSGKTGEAPFAGLDGRTRSVSFSMTSASNSPTGGGGLFANRPYNFWQWRSPKPYWQFLLYMFLTLLALQVLLSPFPDVYGAYSVLIGYVGLSVEATLPLPQIRANMRARSCRGFRVSVLASWLAGDAMKMFWFFTSTTEIPWAFKLCGLFQAVCDSILGIQYFVYGDGTSSARDTDSGGPGIMLKEKEAAFRSAAASILPNAR
ncbi:hypothetical protein HMPREF1624_00395 [Sporothrix schenckii ATCC 58251]|uniref:PQ loop repeat protein n=2 Tax=Sporothrix schenckii TaxID=29908 RepID=U7Q2K9_SPOS1|nr:hypothetical protein HMPREF1624_00395 [Sporothrix schenckii ATCC 58251]